MDFTAPRPLVLLAEADALVAEDLGDALNQAGYRVLGPFATTAEALAAIEWESPALAVLDVKLRDSVCTALGQELRQRGVPILVHSGLQQDDPCTLGFRGLPWLSKPALPNDVVALLAEMASQTASGGTEAAASVSELQLAEERGNPFIRKLEGFVTLSDADRAILERISTHTRLLGPRVDLIREGDKPDGIFLVMAGMVLDLPERQRLLELPDTASRLREERAILRREQVLISELRSLPAQELLDDPPVYN